MRISKVLAATMAALLALAGASLADTPSQIAITFDDIPVHGPLPAGVSRVDIANGFASALSAAKVPPSYAFLNAIALKWDPSVAAVLTAWRQSGNLIGNHSYSHTDPGTITAEAFQADIAANEDVLRATMGDADWHWMRLPFLKEGDTQEKRDSTAAWLTKNGYKLAEVTIAFNDYDYNAPYVRCLAANDTAKVQWLKEQYLAAAVHAIERSRIQSAALFGRDINHVLLLHFGAFDAVMLPAVLDLLKAKNFAFIGLAEAQSDPVYAQNARMPNDWAGMLLTRVMATTNHWVPYESKDPSGEELDKVCR